MSCGCGSGQAGGDLWEARSIGQGTLTLDGDGRTQGTKGEAIEAARAVSDSYLVKV